MPTITRSTAFALTMLLGLVMAAGIHALGEPELAWLGFATAGALSAAGPPRGCLGRRAKGSGA